MKDAASSIHHVVPPHLDDVARLLSDPSRLRILWALGDGRAYTATELSKVANASASAASNHLARMVDAGFIEVRTQGRHRYFTLTREDIGRAVEAMAAITLDAPSASPPLPRVRPALRFARRCYGHLAGECGVALWDQLAAADLLRQGEGGWTLNEAGERMFRALGVEADDASQGVVRPCLDWTERRWHLGGALGRSVLTALQAQGVLSPSPAADRVLLVDPHRWQRLLRSLNADSN
ncbi:MAG: ArsR-family transcriptional regulator [Rhizobacter sp.]|nr:ArsR-family transcriptional regulator [Rhizobacter sp.]